MDKKVAIIGSGPSGLTAAIYTSRASLNTTVFTGLQPGGQLTTTTEIENFPGAFDFEKNAGFTGTNLMTSIENQAKHFGAVVKFGEEIVSLKVNKVDENNKNNSEIKKFTLTNSYGENDDYDAVIIATGAKAKYLGIAGEEKFIGAGYHTCATCDGYFYKDKIVAVVGGGDSAFEEAIYLTKHANKVYILNRSENFKASKIMYNRGLENKKIEIITNAVVESFILDEAGKFSGVNIEKTENLNEEKKGENLVLDGLFVAIGHVPNSSFVKDVLTVNEAGYLLTRKNLLVSKVIAGEILSPAWAKYSSMSEIEGVFIAGDIEDFVYRQAITAAGEGCKAAMDCEKWLED